MREENIPDSRELPRDFKGIWIPREIWLNNKIPALAKILLAEIHSLYNREMGGCFASISYFCKFLGVAERQCYVLLSQLRDLGLVEDVSFNGRTKVIKAVLPKEDQEVVQGRTAPIAEQPCTKMQGSSALKCRAKVHKNAGPSYIERKEEIKKLNKKPAVAGLFDASAIELSDFFLQKLLEMKPNLRKPDKSSWVKHFEAMLRLDKRSMESIKRVIEFVVSDPFESKNVLSPDKLRKRFDQLELKSNVKPSGNAISSKEKSIEVLSKYLVPNNLNIQVLNSCIEFQRRDHPNADIVSFDNKSWENDLLHMINKWGLKKAKIE